MHEVVLCEVWDSQRQITPKSMHIHCALSPLEPPTRSPTAPGVKAMLWLLGQVALHPRKQVSPQCPVLPLPQPLPVRL